MPITETFSGFIETTTDALLVFEACRRGKLPKINRRLQDRERGTIQSGTVFVFDEKESGIKRWTDGLVWSPSRILGNFLIYRELDGRESLYHKVPFEYDSHYLPIPIQQQQQFSDQDNIEPLLGELSNEERNRERNLVGSLTDTYKFRKGGLIKKTISIHLNGSTQHMISYYTRSDVLEGRLATPSSISDLSNLQISPELLLKQSFRVPPSIEFAELMLKRPSLSPSSTNSTTSTTTAPTMRRKSSHAAITTHHSLYEIQIQARVNEDYQSLPLDHSRRLSFESIGNSRKYARMTIDDQHGSIRRRSSLFVTSNSNMNEPRVPPPLSVNTGRMASFPPLPPPPRPPHYLHQYHEGKDVAAPNLLINDTYTRSSTAMNSSPSNSRLSFDSTDLFHDNRIVEKQRYQYLVTNNISNKSLLKQGTQDAYSSPFRLPKNYDSNSSSYERNNCPSLPSPSSLIWSSTNSASTSSINVNQSQQQDYNVGNRLMLYNRLSPPPLPQAAEASPLSLEPTSMYNSPANTYYHRYEKPQENSESNNNSYYSSTSTSIPAAAAAAAAAAAVASSSSSSSSSSTMFNSRNSIHYQLFSSGNNI